MSQAERLNELANAPVGRLLWKYSVPAVVGLVVMSLYNIIDRIFIGQGVGPDAIAGLAITFPVMNVSAAFGVLVGVDDAGVRHLLHRHVRHFHGPHLAPVRGKRCVVALCARLHDVDSARPHFQQPHLFL